MSGNNSIAAGSVVSDITTDSSNNGRGRSHSGRGGGQIVNIGRHSNNTNMFFKRPRGTSFKGTSPEMNGNVFECYNEQSVRRQFTKTVEAIQGHVEKTLKYSEDLALLFGAQSKIPVLAKPTKPEGNPDGTGPDKTDIELWKEDIKDLTKRKRQLRGNLSAFMALIWGQCSEAMKAKVESSSGCTIAEEENDGKWLLDNIKAITMQFDAKHNPYIAMLDATAGFLNCRQQRGQTNDSYLESIKSHTDTIEYHGGTLVMNVDLSPSQKADMTP
jgi:hypothetical protein